MAGKYRRQQSRRQPPGHPPRSPARMAAAPTCSRPAGRYWKTECGAELARPPLRVPRASRASESAGGGPTGGGPALCSAATSVMLLVHCCQQRPMRVLWRTPWRLESALRTAERAARAVDGFEVTSTALGLRKSRSRWPAARSSFAACARSSLPMLDCVSVNECSTEMAECVMHVTAAPAPATGELTRAAPAFVHPGEGAPCPAQTVRACQPSQAAADYPHVLPPRVHRCSLKHRV